MLTRWKELKKTYQMDWPHKVRGCWCTHALGSLGNGVTSCYINMCKNHVENHSKGCTSSAAWLKRSQFRVAGVGKMTDRHALEPLFFGHVKPKKHHFHITKWSKQTTICNWHKIKNKKHNSSVPKPHAGHIFYHRSCAQMITPPRAVSVGRDVVFVCCDIEFNILRVSWVSYMSCVLTANHQLLTCLL